MSTPTGGSVRRYDDSTEHADWCSVPDDHEGKCLDRFLERIGVDPTPQGRLDLAVRLLDAETQSGRQP